jgi:type II secretory pathway component GspD/PulD (secretin)
MLPRTTALVAAGLLAAAVSAQQPAKPIPCLPPTASTTASQPRMVQAVYQVAELVVPVEEMTTAPGKKGKTATTCEDVLIRTIQETVAPKSWASHGGRGTIDYFPMTMTLVVSQTPDVQEQIADLLAKLRRQQDTEVALEVRLVSVPDQFFERIGVDFNAPPTSTVRPCPGKVDAGVLPNPVEGAAGPMVFLSDKQLGQFLEAVQGDQRTNVMQAPKVTLLDGQMGRVDITDKQKFVTGVEAGQCGGKSVVLPKTEEIALGFRMAACPKVSADRRQVMLDLDINQTNLASTAVSLFPVTYQVAEDDKGKPMTFTQYLQQPVVNTIHIEKRLAIPDGKTVLLGGLKKVSEGPCEFGPPVLSKVPYMNRMFKNVGTVREAQMVYVLVTPRVIVNAEEGQRPPTCPARGSPCCASVTKAVLEECEAVAPPSHGPSRAIAELLRAYDEACAAGHKDEAAKLAQAALILDPTCFAKARGK